MVGIEPMAKRRGRPKTSERDDVTVRIDRGVARRLKAVADYRSTSVAELLTDIARGPADRMFAQMLREMEKGEG